MGPVRLCVIGDSLLDIDWEGEVRTVCRDAPAPVVEAPTEAVRPGGAALAATLAVGPGVAVTLVTALSHDDHGVRLAGDLADRGVEVVDLGLDAPTPVKLRLRAAGQSLARVDQGCSPVVAPGPWSAAADRAVAAADAVLVADYGRGMAALPPVVDGRCAAGRPLVWDPHSRGPRPPSTASLVTPNVGEALGLTGDGAPDGAPGRQAVPDLVGLAERLARDLGCPAAVTAGAQGAILADGRSVPAVVPTRAVHGDACGAGDRFAASVAVSLGRGLGWRDAVEVAVADAAAFVAAGPGALGGPAGDAPAGTADGAVVALVDRRPDHEAVDRAARIRRHGSVVVAAGGCFDVLHAGHVQLLEHARRLGDHLVVCLNGDRSVRRLKGAGRPLNPAADRAAVLRSLACVDDVVVFDDDTPVTVLERLRPHLFVKGADYQGAEMPERDALAGWGGHVVLVPLVAGRSTTGLIASAMSAGG